MLPDARQSAWPPYCLFFLALLAFLPFASNGFIWDDDLWVTANPTLRTASGLWDIWFEIGSHPQYYPLVQSAFWLQFQAWGLEPAGYHIVNALLHAASTVVLWRLLERLDVPGAIYGASIFAVHPMQVESVAWITELKNVQAGLFYLLAAHASLTFLEKDGHCRGWARWRHYALALVWFACALTSKTVTASLPAAMLLIAWWKQPTLRIKTVLEFVPMLALGAGMGLVTAWMERRYVGASGADWDFGFLERCLIAGRIAWFYLLKLVWPHPMTFIYPRWEIEASSAFQIALPIAFVACVLAAFLLRRRIGKAPTMVLLLYVGTLVPALGFVNVYPMRFSFVANHFAYHALIAPMAMVGATSFLVLHRLPLAVRHAGRIASAAALGIMLLLTWRQVAPYADANTLWIAVLKENPSCWIAHRNLGQDAFRRGDFHAAEKHLGEVARLAPHVRSAHFDHGTALDRLGRTAEAQRKYELELATHPGEATAHLNLGGLHARAGRLDDAIRHMGEAVRLAPEVPENRFNLALANEHRGKLDVAAEQYAAALRLAPKTPAFVESYLRVMSRLGRSKEAAELLSSLLRDDPGNTAARNALEKLTRPPAGASGAPPKGG